MGTETTYSLLYTFSKRTSEVKLNNPQMGTETSKTFNCSLVKFCKRSVKLNNPQMGTETGCKYCSYSTNGTQLN